LELGADTLGHGPWNAQHVHVAVFRSAATRVDDAQARVRVVTLVITVAGKRLEVVAHHTFSSTRAPAELARLVSTPRHPLRVGQPTAAALGWRKVEPRPALNLALMASPVQSRKNDRAGESADVIEIVVLT